MSGLAMEEQAIERRKVASVADPVGVAASMRALLQEHSAACERERRIVPAVMEALRASGLFHITAPARAGGPGHKLITHIETVAELAKGCVGTAWAYGLLSGVTGSALALPPAIMERLFPTGDELFCSASAPSGKAVAAPGGYRVSGRWGYGSGCLHADWALNGVMIETDQGAERAMAFLDLRDPACSIEDDWHVAGMAGSGSNMIVAQHLFVPEELILWTSRTPPAEAVLAMEGLEPRDRWPMEPLFPLGVLAPMLGAATALLEGVAQAMPKRQVVGWTYAGQSGSEALIGMIGRAAMEIDSAWLHIRRAAGMLDETAQHRVLSGFDKAQIQADCGYAMELVRTAGNRLMDVAGPGAFALSSPLQRIWRDLSVGTRHNALNGQLSLELYGRAITGQPSNIALLPAIAPAPLWAETK
ncbi:alkylation response protein AidB-like acyl-CoA dehydrogenase [Sphingobium fontiphilum]|uniref:Alkylation response protein AidB-like acyl-CoA dehydrogenase n=1 Tax=Sphingobium fontiphilum TaxID=944425 RepID=A0A7W6DKG7_9SPHN|nr:acyl-CoA dehydrogenase family protein [Sphingobium fontiphilum]MBB3982320.1 alkylation response protein AidB-like acyl-CoA dehydrogenase [Sphingobium fontiphilum]